MNIQETKEELRGEFDDDEEEFKVKNPPKNRKKLILIITSIIVLLLIIGISLFIYFYFFFRGKQGNEPTELTELELQNETYKTFRNLSENLYIMDIKHNYFFEEIESTNQLKNITSFINVFLIKFNKTSPDKIKNFKYNFSFACSAFNAYNSKNINLLGRNFDYSRSPALVIWTHPKNKYKSISFVSLNFTQKLLQTFAPKLNHLKDFILLAPFIPMDGINEKGLSMAVLALRTSETHQENENKINTITTLIIRGILDNCENVDQAIEYIEERNMHDFINSYHYIISDKNKSVIIEYVGKTQNRELRILTPENYTKSKNIYLTNFYLSEDGEEKTIGKDRYEILETNIKEKKGIFEWNEVINLLEKVKQNSTLWSNVYNPEELSVISSQNKNYDVLVKFDAVHPLMFKNVDKK